MKKIGRNEPCWCDSGKKYKKCHLDRHLENSIQPWEVDRELKKKFGVNNCSCPDSMKQDCNGKIVKAHTVSKSSSLQAIADRGHVYGLKFSIDRLSKNNGRLKPERIGINQASTFTGFCGTHDNSLFSAFEDNPFTGSLEQVFLIGYRSLSREYYTKMSQQNMKPSYNNIDRGRPESEQRFIQRYLHYHSTGVSIGARDIQVHKASYDDVLVSGIYDEVRAHVIQFSEVLPIACSGAFLPKIDFNGERLQDFLEIEKVLDILCFSIFSSEKDSYAVFTWLENSDTTCSKFIASLGNISDERLFPILMQFACTEFENIFFSPDWWDNLEEKMQVQIINWLNFPTHLNFDALMDKDVEIGRYPVSWRNDIGVSNNAIN